MGVGNTAHPVPKGFPMPHSPETLEAPSLYVRLSYCLHLPTVLGETFGTYDPDTYVRDTFGPFGYLEARAFIVTAIAGRADLPLGLPVHDASIFTVGDDYEDEIVETWTARFTNGSKCKSLDPHRAGEA